MHIKKVKKGEFGYLKYKKNVYLAIMLVLYAFIVAAFASGWIVTGTKENIMTVVAVVMALPAAKFTVSYIIMIPHHAASTELYNKTKDGFAGLITCYDLVFSNGTSPIGTQMAVVADTLVIALTDEKNADRKLFEKSVKEFMEKDSRHVTVSLYTDEASFLSKANVMCAGNAAGSAPSMRIERNYKSLLNMCL